MRLGITHKLFFVILLATALAVIASTLVMQWNINRGFLRFVNSIETDGIPRMAAALEEEYRQTMSWDGLKKTPMRWLHIIATTLPEGGTVTPDLDSLPDLFPPHLTQQFDRRLFLQDSEGKLVIGPADDLKNSKKVPIYHQGMTVGYLGILPHTDFSLHSQQRFLNEQRSSHAIIALVVITLSGLFSLLVARRLVRPVTMMTDVARQLALGAYELRAPVTSDDELGCLARDINSLALSLGRNEGARRQLVQDLSHEFRTPLTFLRSQIEAIIDGVRQPEPRALHALHHEVLRLGRLVDDLYQLSQSDVGAQIYRKEDVDIDILLTDVMDRYASDFLAKEIVVSKKSVPGKKIVFADPARLRQLCTNLFDNTLKYTDNGGTVVVEIARGDRKVTINIQDSAPGVASDDLPRLFDRLYRVESSRNRATGGSGLGLSICRKIVEAHEGTIEALPSPLGGIRIKIELPCRGCNQ